MRRAGWLVAAYAGLVLSSIKDVGNPDLFWHLSAGRRILDTGRVPDADWLSFTREGAPWVDFEWLAQLAILAAHALAGWWGLIALKLGLMLGAARLLERELGRRGLGYGERACAVAVLTAAWCISNDMRVDWFTHVFVAAELVVLERLRAGWRPDVRKAAAAAFVSGVVWTNLHGGFVMGLVIAGAYAALSPSRTVWTLLAAGAAGTLVTPYGLDGYRVVLEHMRATPELTRYITEWRWSSPRNNLTLPMWALLAGCGLSAWLAAPKRREFAPWAVLVGLAALALAHQRNIPLFTIAAVFLPPLLLDARLGFKLHRLAAPLNVLLAAAFVLQFSGQNVSRDGLHDDAVPEGVASYLRRHPEVAAKRLHNPWGWGGYLAWRVGPPYKVYYDGRYIFHDLLAPSMVATRHAVSWNKFLDDEKLDGAILTRNEPDLRVSWEDAKGRKREKVVPYYDVFMPRKKWKLVYSDLQAVVFVRR